MVDVCQLPHMGVLTDVVKVHIVARELHVILSLPCTALGIFVASCGSQYLCGITPLLSTLRIAASARCARGRRRSGRRLLIFGFLLQDMLETTFCYPGTLPFRYQLNTISSAVFEHCPLPFPLGAVAGIWSFNSDRENVSISMLLSVHGHIHFTLACQCQYLQWPAT